MPEPDPALAEARPAVSLEAAEAMDHQLAVAYTKLIEKGTPWLFEVGSWIFGGLIAFTLVIMSALLNIGPVDMLIKVACAALALALPLDVTGLVLLRLFKDMKPVTFEQTVSQTFEEAGMTPGALETPSLTSLQAMRIRGTQIALRYASVILSLSALLTLAGMTAALWRMAWWISAAFLATVALSLIVALVAVTTAQPPASAEEKARRKVYRDELVRQAKEQARQAKALARQSGKRRR